MAGLVGIKVVMYVFEALLPPLKPSINSEASASSIAL
jgi:hypothetical protein